MYYTSGIFELFYNLQAALGYTNWTSVVGYSAQTSRVYAVRKNRLQEPIFVFMGDATTWQQHRAKI